VAPAESEPPAAGAGRKGTKRKAGPDAADTSASMGTAISAAKGPKTKTVRVKKKVQRVAYEDTGMYNHLLHHNGADSDDDDDSEDDDGRHFGFDFMQSIYVAVTSAMSRRPQARPRQRILGAVAASAAAPRRNGASTTRSVFASSSSGRSRGMELIELGSDYEEDELVVTNPSRRAVTGAATATRIWCAHCECYHDQYDDDDDEVGVPARRQQTSAVAFASARPRSVVRTARARAATTSAASAAVVEPSTNRRIYAIDSDDDVTPHTSSQQSRQTGRHAARLAGRSIQATEVIDLLSDDDDQHVVAGSSSNSSNGSSIGLTNSSFGSGSGASQANMASSSSSPSSSGPSGASMMTKAFLEAPTDEK
jgi:hypothetical protein